ncbi:hypothetical protein F4604DRAFT_295871 [Suillus subluteus]|nr:hypothetical protein F4604DRAFT_295871 [Suillus subluteus]
MYEKRGIDYIRKAIIFGDRLNLKKVKELNEQCLLLGFKCSFGIGTWLTNDFKKKSGRYGKECVKISDETTKVEYLCRDSRFGFIINCHLRFFYRIREFRTLWQRSKRCIRYRSHKPR